MLTFLDTATQTMNLTKSITDFAAGDMASGFAAVGKGIGAIMLLIVVIYYISSILDGGKFQLKMLFPLLIFLFVCNFSWISKPVLSFTSTITGSLTTSVDNTRFNALEQNGLKKSATIADMHNNEVVKEQRGMSLGYALIGPGGQLLYNIFSKSRERRLGGSSATDAVNASADDQRRDEGGFLHRKIKKGVHEELLQLSADFQAEASGEDYQDIGSDVEDTTKKQYGSDHFTWSKIILVILSWITKILSTVLRAFGAVMTGIIVAFGPITFAFAILPGQGGTIKSWFIRLCQFSLYAPIVSLIDSFVVQSFYLVVNGNGESILMSIALTVCSLVALTSVPSIASMIIEGAQGAVSLSGGLQQIGGAVAKGAAVGGGAAAIVIGKDRMQALKDIGHGMQNVGIGGVANVAGRVASGSASFKGAMRTFQASGRASRLERK